MLAGIFLQHIWWSSIFKLWCIRWMSLGQALPATGCMCQQEPLPSPLGSLNSIEPCRKNNFFNSIWNFHGLTSLFAESFLFYLKYKTIYVPENTSAVHYKIWAKYYRVCYKNKTIIIFYWIIYCNSYWFYLFQLSAGILFFVYLFIYLFNAI